MSKPPETPPGEAILLTPGQPPRKVQVDHVTDDDVRRRLAGVRPPPLDPEEMAAASEPFDYRQTGDGIFQVDAGDVHLGTVQRFGAHEWWAYPADNPGQTSYTRTSREDAAKALLSHVMEEAGRVVAAAAAQLGAVADEGRKGHR